MKRLVVAFVLGCAGFALAQDTEAPKPPDRPRQDAEALKLIERFDSLLYMPRAAGLKDLEFTVRLPGGFDLLVRWKEPDRVKASLAVAADAPADHKKQLELIAPKFEPEAKKHAPSFVSTQIGEPLRDKHKDDELTMIAPGQVKIVARSEASTAQFKEQALSFDDRGLVTRVKVVAPTGLESVILPTFAPLGGRFVYQAMKTTIAKEESTVTFEYVEAGGFHMIGTLTTASKSMREPQKLVFAGFKPNSGLDDKLFEEPKPAAPK